jgi:hypothetical protein
MAVPDIAIPEPADCFINAHIGCPISTRQRIQAEKVND